MKLGIVPIRLIDIGDRFRKDYKDLDSLARSMKERGLICPVAISNHPEVKDAFLLNAGGRRMAAANMLGWTEIPCRIYNHVLSDLELRSIELEENLHREDLEFDEECRLMREIHELQEKIHGKKTSTAPDAPGISMRDTANLLNISHATLSKDISLANAMDQIPEIDWKKCKNKSEALKLKDKVKEKLVREELSKQAEKKLGKKDTLASNIAKAYIIKDFFEASPQIPDGCMDLVELDPPYAIDLGSQKKVDKSLGNKPYEYGKEGYNEIKKEDYETFMRRTFGECYRVMSTNSWLICWFGPEPWFEPMFQWAIDAGFRGRRLTGIWVKGEDPDKAGYVERTSGQANNPTIYLANASEHFFYFAKGKPSICRPGRTNVFGYKPVPPSKKIHPTERPLELMQDILTTFAKENSRVLVPFAGSGNTLLSAAMSKMIPLGFDLTDQYRQGYVIRINEIFKEV